jgi:hypothetical protein
MPKNSDCLLLLLGVFTGLSLGLSAAAEKNPPRNPAPVSVSSVNFAETSRDDLYRLENESLKQNPATPALKPLTKPLRYVFLPGNVYKTDLSYEETCERLAAALKEKGFINATDAQGRVYDAENVDLILRVHSGERPWRTPTVRMSQLTWRDGLDPRPLGRTLRTLGGNVAWDHRSGGNDDAFGAAALNENAGSFGFGSTPATPAGGSPLNAGSASSITQANAAGEYDATRDYYLIVVDAFSYAELKEKGDRAKRLWTTFVAAPRQPNQKFSDVLTTMLKVATPYFGESTSGLQMYNDARATVTIREMEILDSSVKLEGKN